MHCRRAWLCLNQSSIQYTCICVNTVIFIGSPAWSISFKIGKHCYHTNNTGKDEMSGSLGLPYSIQAFRGGTPVIWMKRYLKIFMFVHGERFDPLKKRYVIQ